MAFALNKSVSWKVGLSILGAGSAVQMFHGSKDLLPLVTSGALGSLAVLASMKLAAHLWKTMELSNELSALKTSVQDITSVNVTVEKYKELVLKMQSHFDNSFDSVIMQGHSERWALLCDLGKSILDQLDLDSEVYVQHSVTLTQVQDLLFSSFTLDELEASLKARKLTL